MLRVTLLALAVGLAMQSGSSMDATRSRLDAARAAVSAPDRASRLAAFQHLRDLDDGSLVRTVIDAALRNDDGVLQAAALRELFRLSGGFQIALKESNDTLPAGRVLLAGGPRIWVAYSDFDEETATMRGSAIGGMPLSGEGQLTGTLLTIGGARDLCALQVQLADPWRMEGWLRCQSLGRFDATVDLAALPENGVLGNTLIAPRIPLNVRADNARRRTQVSKILRGNAQNRLQEGDLAIAVRKGAGGASERDVFLAWLRDADHGRRSAAIRQGLCHADAAIQSEALSALMANVESLPIRHIPDGEVRAPGGPASRWGSGTRDYVVVRPAASGKLAAYRHGDVGAAAVDGAEASITISSGTPACTYRLAADCSGGPERQPERLAGSSQCRGLGNGSVEVGFWEARWQHTTGDIKDVAAAIQADTRSIRELLDLLARQDAAEQLGALEALAGSTNPLALDLALEASLSSQLSAARTLALPLILKRSRLLVVTADAPDGARASTGSTYGLVSSQSNESLAAARQVYLRFPGWTAHLPLQVGATRLTAADDRFKLFLHVDPSGELRGTFESQNGTLKQAIRAMVR